MRPKSLHALRETYGASNELGLPLTLRELGASEDMLPLIANSTVPGGGYKKMTAEDILTVLKECY